jgi:polyphosphate glucokinase
VTELLGIDIGGSGAKGAVVNTRSGALVTDRHKVPTPQPVPPERMGEIVGEIVSHHAWTGPVGIAIPSIVRNGVVSSAANIHPDWIGVDAISLFERRVAERVTVLNDADAAAIAESRLGAGRGTGGLMILLTLGTGIGSGFVHNGVLLPNSELGHLEFKGGEAEDYAAASVRERLDLSWDTWVGRLNEFLTHVVSIFSPQLIVLGGGIAKEMESGSWYPLVAVDHTRTALTEFRNNAGIVGAALAAADAD